MLLTSESMDEYGALWNDEDDAPDEPNERAQGFAVVVLIADGDLQVDPLELF